MLFTSPSFIFFFLPLSLLSHWINFKKLRNASLLASSLIFYAWGEPEYILVLVFSILLNWSIGILLASKSNKKLFLFIGCFINLCLLGIFKYLNFFLATLGLTDFIEINFGVNVALIHLPIGISFFTFQALSYLVDIYRFDTAPQSNIVDFGLYLSLFPQLIAGPIVRYVDVAKELNKRIFSYMNLVNGFNRFSVGLAKKVLIANPAGALSDGIFNSDYSTLNYQSAWLGVLAYSIQIFFDFSGYSDMAIGIGKMFGFKFPENFNYPYISKSIQEFWRRWHITLSSFFRDYVYIPLGGSRVSETRVYINIMIIFLLTGLWHGASWNFVLWGLFHGTFLCLERIFLGNWLNKMHAAASHVYTLLIVGLGWVIFRIEDTSRLKTYLFTMFNFEGSMHSLKMDSIVDYSESILAIFLGILLCIPLINTLEYICSLFRIKNLTLPTSKTIRSFGIGFSTSLLLVFSLAKISADTYNPFIYFRF